MICWFCHWGWPKEIADIAIDALAELDGDDSPLHFGPGHIVWADENFGREHVQWCLDLYDPEKYAQTQGRPSRGETFEAFYGDRFSPHDLAVVKRSLERLLELPDSVLEPEPPGYADDDEFPEKYPPHPSLKMVKSPL